MGEIVPPARIRRPGTEDFFKESEVTPSIFRQAEQRGLKVDTVDLREREKFRSRPARMIRNSLMLSVDRRNSSSTVSITVLQVSFLSGDRSMKKFIAVGALILVLGASVRADDFSVTITAGDVGQDISNGQYAGTFFATDTTTPT